MSLEHFERYQILARVGSGGMADVFLGVHLGEQQFRHLVVIKRIRPDFIKNKVARQMFVDEALTVANISHPHIVQIHDLRELDSGLCIAMEYVNGETLSFLLKQLNKMGRRIPLDVACKIMIEACEGLHAAHTAMGHDGELLNLVHRDISPHNLMLNRNGYLKIIDFGIAKSRLQGDKTIPGTVKGKYSYLSPDHFQQSVDHRSDIYALGLVFFEMLTGHKAVESKDMSLQQLMQVVLTRPLPKVSQLVSGVPIAFDEVLARATAKDHADRHQDAESLAADIRSAAARYDGVATNARVRTWMERTFKACLENRIKLEKKLLGEAKRMVTQPGIRLAPDQLPIQEHPCEDGACEIDDAPMDLLSVAPTPSPIGTAHHIIDQTEMTQMQRFAWFGWVVALVVIVLVIGVWLGSRGFFSKPTPLQPVVIQGANTGVTDRIASSAVPPSAAAPSPAVQSAPDAAVKDAVVKDAAKPVVDAQIKDAVVVAKAPTRRWQPKPKPAKPKPVKPTAPAEPKTPPVVVVTAAPVRTVRVTRKSAAPATAAPATAAPATEPPKPAYLSGSGTWSGAKTWRSGCGQCHGSSAKPLDPNALSARQWGRLLRRRSRHDRHAKLSKLFSASELSKVRAYAISKRKKDTSTGVAGVR